ncbi:uncharacterized protein LOC128302895 [Anopheles moucheti]|uniref:uncharacterized protein LOC128302895 n=1 Tax=Anopheles moucheti TaxID=186751 RepID=UPI0022F04B27|nr:uncharacterized protein LOC128302895 [Anopheles moucheti]
MAPAMNLIRSVGKKVIVEYEGRVFSIPEQDFLQVSRSDVRCGSKHDLYYGTSEGVDRTLYDTYSEISDSNSSNENLNRSPQATNPINPVVSSSAAKVLAELKEEVTRLIDVSIQKIELEWVQNSNAAKDAPCEAVPPEATIDSVLCAQATSKSLHPDGDRSQLTHREQNLQVLHTEQFMTCKRQTRMRLLNEIRELVERLKDLETLEN